MHVILYLLSRNKGTNPHQEDCIFPSTSNQWAGCSRSPQTEEWPEVHKRIYEDYCPDVLEQRMAYHDAMAKLYNLDLRPALLYRTKLQITDREGNKIGSRLRNPSLFWDYGQLHNTIILTWEKCWLQGYLTHNATAGFTIMACSAGIVDLIALSLLWSSTSGNV